MLNAQSAATAETTVRRPAPFWIDLVSPTPDVVARIESETGITVPSRESLQEIETSSRLRAEGKVLYVSMPLAIQDYTVGFAPIPLGFIVSPQLLITVRYSEVHAFAQAEAQMKGGHVAGSGAAFVAIMNGMVDFDADMLEKLSSELASVSATAFTPAGSLARRDKRVARALRDCLNAIGTAGDQLSRIRESLLGLQRIIGFVLEMAADWLLPEEKSLMVTARQDLTSLVDFEGHLSGKTQFLLDAILGFINTEQNDIFKVLTIASVVGIPPTLIASMYGMNFHNMPELSWRWGYQYGIVLIALSAVVPIIWFKRRGWW